MLCGALGQDLNWRAQIDKENQQYYREKKAQAERLSGMDSHPTAVEIETQKRIFGDSNVMTKMVQRQDPDHANLGVDPKVLEQALKKELRAMSESVQDIARKLATEMKRRIEAEVKV